MVKRQIIALGGGGFSMEPLNPLLDLYILKQSDKEKPKPEGQSYLDGNIS